MRILMIGDIFGAPGRHMALQHVPRLIREHNIDFTIANGENAANGLGLNRKSFDELAACGVDAFTLGNHTWGNRELASFIEGEPRLLRPLNYPPGLPGRGWQRFSVGGHSLVVVNLIGRVFMEPYDCPFRAMNQLLSELEPRDKHIFVDFHAEATSEKMALAWYLDGRVSAVCGTHTHVQTNDARLLPRGAAYLTDAGMTGPRDSVLGVERDIIIERFLTGFSPRFEPAQGDLQFNGAVFELDDQGRAANVETINFWQPSL